MERGSPPALRAWLSITSENISAVFSGQSKHQASLDSRAGKQAPPSPPRPTPLRKELQSHSKDSETGKSKCFRCCLQSTSDTVEGSGPTPNCSSCMPGRREARGVTGREEVRWVASESVDPTPETLSSCSQQLLENF